MRSGDDIEAADAAELRLQDEPPATGLPGRRVERYNPSSAALQPLLLRLGREEAVRPLRLVDTSGRTSEVGVKADSVAEAVARAIRGLEREGAHVRSVEVLERTGAPDNGATPR